MVCDKDPLALDVTPSTADLLLSLREQLQFIVNNVSPTLTPHIVEDIAIRTDKILVTEVRLEGGREGDRQGGRQEERGRDGR